MAIFFTFFGGFQLLISAKTMLTLFDHSASFSPCSLCWMLILHINIYFCLCELLPGSYVVTAFWFFSMAYTSICFGIDAATFIILPTRGPLPAPKTITTLARISGLVAEGAKTQYAHRIWIITHSRVIYQCSSYCLITI